MFDEDKGKSETEKNGRREREKEEKRTKKPIKRKKTTAEKVRES